MKERPRIVSVVRIGADGSKPKFRLRKITLLGRRRQITVSLVSADSLPIVEREFLRE